MFGTPLGAVRFTKAVEGVQYLFVASDRRCVLRACENNDADYDDETKCTHTIRSHNMETGIYIPGVSCPFFHFMASERFWVPNKQLALGETHITVETHIPEDTSIQCVLCQSVCKSA